jgi:hypothetical protein
VIDGDRASRRPPPAAARAIIATGLIIRCCHGQHQHDDYTDAAIATHACRRRLRERERFSVIIPDFPVPIDLHISKRGCVASKRINVLSCRLSSAAAFYTGAVEREGHGREKMSRARSHSQTLQRILSTSYVY